MLAYTLHKNLYSRLHHNNTHGYNIQAKMSSTGIEAQQCKNISCNVTLEECPDNENYGIGDLRVMQGIHTVAGVSPCTKLSYPN